MSALQIPETSSGRRPLPSLYRKPRTRAGHFIGGGADHGCMNDLVVTQEAVDMESGSCLDFLWPPDLGAHVIA